MIDRIALSIMVGFVAAVVITGVYSVSETRSYNFGSCVGATYVQNRFGLPLPWILTTYSASYGSCLPCYYGWFLRPHSPSASINLSSFGLDVLFFSFFLLPLTRLSRNTSGLDRGAEPRPRLARKQISDKILLHEKVVVAASALSAVWLVLYFVVFSENVLLQLGLSPRAVHLFEMSVMIEPLSVVFAIVGVVGSLLSTWRFYTGGAILVSAGAFLLFVPGLFLNMLFLNPEFGMLYVLWTSTTILGGFGSLLAGVHRAHVRNGIIARKGIIVGQSESSRNR